MLRGHLGFYLDEIVQLGLALEPVAVGFTPRNLDSSFEIDDNRQQNTECKVRCTGSCEIFPILSHLFLM